MTFANNNDIAYDLHQINELLSRTSAFEGRIFSDEPIVRRGMDRPARKPKKPRRSRKRDSLPSQYKKMRALGANRNRFAGENRFGAHLFYEQARLMEDFEDDFEGESYFSSYYSTYEMMSNYDLRCYFSWRTRFRKWLDSGDFKSPAPAATLSFLYLHVYELLCGVGTEPGLLGFKALQAVAHAYAGDNVSFDAYLARWSNDYVVYHGLDQSLLQQRASAFSLAAAAVVRRAEVALLSLGKDVPWPDEQVEGLPTSEELLDALCALSRYRAERSRFVRDHRNDVAEVASHVFARMVGHCAKRRKTGYVDGLFGESCLVSYSMFSGAVVWFSSLHPDVTYEANPAETFVCERGFWWRELPCRRQETSRELGALLHAIDCRMRARMGYGHSLKARSLPKYQARFVDAEIESLLERRKAEEESRIVIDHSALQGIRSAAVRTQEALLTDEERLDEEPVAAAPLATSVVARPKEVQEVVEDGRTTCDLSLDQKQLDFLRELLEGRTPDLSDSLFVSLAVDAINEAFLDIVGDTVIDFDGSVPVFVPDYEQDVLEVL